MCRFSEARGRKRARGPGADHPTTGTEVGLLTALGSFRTYVGLLRYNFAAKRPNYLPTQLPSAASGRKTYLPTYLPIRRPPRKNLPTVPTFYSHF